MSKAMKNRGQYLNPSLLVLLTSSYIPILPLPPPILGCGRIIVWVLIHECSEDIPSRMPWASSPAPPPPFLTPPIPGPPNPTPFFRPASCSHTQIMSTGVFPASSGGWTRPHSVQQQAWQARYVHNGLTTQWFHKGRRTTAHRSTGQWWGWRTFPRSTASEIMCSVARVLFYIYW
jgi:hypothetical protein